MAVSTSRCRSASARDGRAACTPSPPAPPPPHAAAARRAVPAALGAGRAAGLHAELRGEHQPDGDRLAVPPPEVLDPLDRVAEGVAVVEVLAHAGVEEVLANGIGLDRDRAL